MTPTTLEPTSIRLVRTGDLRSRASTWATEDGRFHVVLRIPSRRTEPNYYDITDTARTDWVDRPGQGNVVRVFELDDARALIAKAIRRTPRRGRSAG